MKRIYTPEERDQIFYEIEEAKATIKEIRKKKYRTPQDQDRLDLELQKLRTLRSM